MTRSAPLFGAYTSNTQVALVALVSVTVTARAVVFSDARCSSCNRKLMAIPGTPTIEVRSVKNDDARSGRGRVVGCPRCKTLNEVIEHR